MNKTALITGGAGFIGSHLSELLVEEGWQVRILDNLHPQIHGAKAELPEYLDKSEIQFIKGDITNRNDVVKALKGVDIVIHLAAETGVGQSMYEIERYVNTNVRGTAVLLDAIVDSRYAIKKIILASSRAVYGEGKYRCRKCGIVYPESRGAEQIQSRQWEPVCPRCQGMLNPLPTDEESPLNPQSVYAITKQTQEQLIRRFGKSYRIPFVILRYQNVYGPRQSLRNPYTGVLSTFAMRIMNNKPPLILEDGKQSRDFVYIYDAARATMLAVVDQQVQNEILNVGTGRRVTILEIAKLLLKEFGSQLEPRITGTGRVGDIRHCFADLSRIQNKLGFKPAYDIVQGIKDFASWVKKQPGIADLSKEANKELEERGLLI